MYDIIWPFCEGVASLEREYFSAGFCTFEKSLLARARAELRGRLFLADGIKDTQGICHSIELEGPRENADVKLIYLRTKQQQKSHCFVHTA